LGSGFPGWVVCGVVLLVGGSWYWLGSLVGSCDGWDRLGSWFGGGALTLFVWYSGSYIGCVVGLVGLNAVCVRCFCI